MMTVVVPLCAFFNIDVIAFRSLLGKLFFGLEILTSASSVLTSSRYDSRVNDG